MNELNHSIFKVQTAGRINIIGEHTDHQLGFVLPISINAKITIYGTKRDDKQILAYSENFNEKYILPISKIENFSPHKGVWFNYVIGIAKWFNNRNPMTHGCNIIITSELPQGAGLSSSAALEIGLLTLFEHIYEFVFDPYDAINLCWEVENNFIGVKCGIMDQFIVKFGLENIALKINCADLTYEKVKLPLNMRLLIIDTNVKHSLIKTPYNTRIEECKFALKKIISLGFNISNLSELSLNDLQEIRKKLEIPYYSRVKHVVTENIRVNKFYDILKDQEATNTNQTLLKLGKLLYESHESLRLDFESSWERADLIVEYCKKKLPSEIYGARMVGGGWGGAVLIMVNTNSIQKINKNLEDWFSSNFHEKAIIYQFRTSNGTEFSRISKNELPLSCRPFFT